MATNHPPITYPPRFFPKGMRVKRHPNDEIYTYLNKGYGFTSGIKRDGISDGYFCNKDTDLIPCPEGVLGFTPPMLQAILDGRKTQTTVPIRKKVFKVGDIARVGEPHFHDDDDDTIIVFQDGMAVLQSSFEYTDRFASVVDTVNKYLSWHKPTTLPLWATRYFLRITGVETKAPCEFTEAEILAEGIWKAFFYVDFWTNGDMIARIGTYEDRPFSYWKALWLSAHPKDGEKTFKQPHTVYTFELIGK